MMVAATRERVIRVAAVSLCVVGTLMVGYAGIQYLKGTYRADVARREWDAAQAHASVALAREKAARSVSIAAGQVVVGSPVARLRIPRIHLDEVVLEGVGDDELNAAPGHLPGSALPGMRGNAVISAHRDRHFSRLDQLQLGDTIRTETSQLHGAWVIVGRRVVGRDTPALFESADATLTLTTCWPVRYFGSAPDRLILTAKPVPNAKPGAPVGAT